MDPDTIKELIKRWEKRVEKIKRKRRKTKNLRYEVLYSGKLQQLNENIVELKAILPPED